MLQRIESILSSLGFATETHLHHLPVQDVVRIGNIRGLEFFLKSDQLYLQHCNEVPGPENLYDSFIETHRRFTSILGLPQIDISETKFKSTSRTRLALDLDETNPNFERHISSIAFTSEVVINRLNVRETIAQ
jgi:hypothetical protein